MASANKRVAFFSTYHDSTVDQFLLELQGQAHHWYSVVLRLDIHIPVYENRPKGSATAPEFHDVLPEDQLPMTLTAESHNNHVVIAWGAECSYDGNFSALSFKLFWSCFLKLGISIMGCCCFFSEAQGVTSIQFLYALRIIGRS